MIVSFSIFTARTAAINLSIVRISLNAGFTTVKSGLDFESVICVMFKCTLRSDRSSRSLADERA